MRKVWALLLAVTLLVIGASLALAQDEETDAVVETLVVEIDEVTRTLTVTFVPTGVLSVAVGPAPVVDTFAVTATGWLSDLNESLVDVKLDNQELDIKSVYATLDDLFEETDTTAYPTYYTPFVRQYRFAIHSCRLWLRFHEGFTTNEDSGGIFMVGPYLTLQTACYEQYQDAYVEMERIVHPMPSVAVVETVGKSTVAASAETEQVDHLGFTYVLQPGDEELTLIEWIVYKNSNGDLEFAG